VTPHFSSAVSDQVETSAVEEEGWPTRMRPSFVFVFLPRPHTPRPLSMSNQFTPQFYRRFYESPRTRVTTQAAMQRRARAVAAIVKHLELKVTRILDAGCRSEERRVGKEWQAMVRQ